MTMRPFFFCFMAGRQAFTARKVPLRFVPRTSSHFSAVMSASFAAGKMPALAHSTSMPPCCFAAASAMRCMSSHLVTSAASAAAWPPPALISSAVFCAALPSRATTSTRAPLLAKTRAMPLPMPLLEPVTTTDRPAIDVNMVLLPIGLASPELAQIGCRQVAGALGVGLAQTLRQLGFRVRADPGHQQQAAQHDERRYLRALFRR